MKSAALQGNFQRVRARCERIFAKGRHFPSELAGSRSYSTNSPARQTPLFVSKVLALLFYNARMRVVPRKLCFSVPILERELGLYFYYEYHKKGGTPTCVFPLFSLSAKIHPFVALLTDKEISRLARRDRRSRRLRQAFEKA